MDESKSATSLFEHSKDRIGDISWRALGGLNAGRTVPVPISHTRGYMQLAAKLPIALAYPVISWVIENANRQLRGTPQARTIIRGMFDAAWHSAELTAKMVLLKKANDAKLPISFASFSDGGTIIRSGERARAIEQIRSWISDNVTRYLKLCDPYIGPEEVAQILKLVLASSPRCTVSILTSRKVQPTCSSGETLEEMYAAHWRRVCDQAPPDCQVVVAGLRSSGEPPIHDRWWVTENAGLRFGTSFGDIGVGKDSDIVKMAAPEATERELRMNDYFRAEVREQKGEKIVYRSFTLDK